MRAGRDQAQTLCAAALEPSLSRCSVAHAPATVAPGSIASAELKLDTCQPEALQASKQANSRQRECKLGVCTPGEEGPLQHYGGHVGGSAKGWQCAPHEQHGCMHRRALLVKSQSIAGPTNLVKTSPQQHAPLQSLTGNVYKVVAVEVLPLGKVQAAASIAQVSRMSCSTVRLHARTHAETPCRWGLCTVRPSRT